MNSSPTTETRVRPPSNFGPPIHRESEEDAALRSDVERILPRPVGEGTPLRGRWTNRARSASPGLLGRRVQAVADRPALALGIAFAIGMLAGRALLPR